MRQTSFTICDAAGIARSYTASKNPDGSITIHYGFVCLPNPSETLLAGATIALQAQAAETNDGMVIDINDHR